MFVDKEKIIEDYFAPIEAVKGGLFIKWKPSPKLRTLKRFQFEKEYLMLICSYYGYDAKYFTDDSLYEAFGENLPDNIEGEMVLFYNVEDLCRKFGI